MKTFITKQIVSLIAIMATAFGAVSCVENKFNFPIEDLYNHGLTANITVADLKAMYSTSAIEIKQNLIVEGNVCSSDKEGNIYKTLYIQDATGGLPIVVDQTNINNLYRVGRKVLIKLKGLYLGTYNGLVQLGMIPSSGETSPSRIPANMLSQYLAKDLEVKTMEPEVVTISEISNRSELMGTLIKINKAQFAAPDGTYSDADASANRTVEDEDGNTIILRNSNYATFAMLPMPVGSGSITGVLSIFSGTYQLLIRDTADVAFYSPRFGSGGGAEGSNVILRETFGTTATQNPNWPSVEDYTGYLREGLGAAVVTYASEGGAVSARNNSPSSDYAGASGSVNAMMAAAGASLLVGDIATCGATNLVLTFGSNESNTTLSVEYKINGTTTWVPLSYTKASATWGLVNTSFTLPSGANTIKLRFKAAATTYGTRVDDIKLTTDDATSNPIIDPDDGSGGGGTGTGDGTQANPYDVAYTMDNQNSQTAWVIGYIVGGIIDDPATPGGTDYQTSTIDGPEDVVFGTNVRNTAVLIADSKTETDYTKCAVVNLPTGAIRTAVNLKDNPANLGKWVKFNGVLRTYFGRPGVRDLADYELEGGGGTPPPGNDIFNETLLTQTSFDKFTKVSVNGAQAWTFDTQYGAVMSGYDNATTSSYANEDWFISPAIDLSGHPSAKLSFDHARGPAASITVGIAQGWYKVFVSNNYTSGAPTTATWTELTGVTHGTVAWAYVSSGELNIPSANLAANCRIAFKYVCSDTESATWEVRNIVVKE
ncbi:MAG: DUF5689 domain-containing protein [Prevotellaceae bacterium]|jgi:hypothetical protein|nr:DUF5689 domain-containing protein [Prevotellaceae bacterium]